METEVEKIRSDHCSWEAEIWIMKQQQENTQKGLVFLKDCLQATENRQLKMETFLAESSTNPDFIPQFIQQLVYQQQQEADSNNGDVDWSASTMLPFLKPKHLQLKGLKKTTSSFMRRTFEMVDDPNTNSIISWGASGTSFFIHDKSKIKGLLLQYFGHDTLKNFTNCLNAYGFKRVDALLNEFVNERFQKGQKHMIKHIKKRPNKAETMKNLVEDMKAELKRLRDHQNTIIQKEIFKLKTQEAKTKSYLASVKEGIQLAKCKLIQIKEASNASPPMRKCFKKEARPWLAGKADLDKLKSCMEKMEVDILNLESVQEFKMNHLVGLEGSLHNTKCRQQQLEIYMDETLRILDYGKGVKKQPKMTKFYHGKITRRRKPITSQGQKSSVDSTYTPRTNETYRPNSPALDYEDLLWAKELEGDLKIESEEHETDCPENSEDLNMWARDLEDDLTCESETHDVLGQNRNENLEWCSPENYEDIKKLAGTFEDDKIVGSVTQESNSSVQEQSRSRVFGTDSPVNSEDIDLYVSILQGDLNFE